MPFADAQKKFPGMSILKFEQMVETMVSIYCYAEPATPDSGFRVWGLGFVWGLESGVEDFGFWGKNLDGHRRNAESATRRSQVHTHDFLTGILPCMI